MNFLNCYLYLCFSVAANAFEFANEHGMEIKFRINSKILCLSDNGRFSGKEDITLIECVLECALRPHCAAVTYRRHYNICNMYLVTFVNNTSRGNCVYVQASQIEVTLDPCGNCKYGQYCDLASKNCIYEDCLMTNISMLADTEGNNFGVGERIKIVECVPGYHMPYNVISGSTVCLKTGQWDTSARCVKDCGEPPDIQNGQAILINLDQTNILCDAGYQTTKPIIICEEAGSWESTTCEALDCGNPPNINRGNVNLIDFYIASVSCDEGYQPTNDTMLCTVSGAWEPVTCKRIECGNPPTIANGHVALIDIYSGDIICNAGYQTMKPTINCTKTGSWETSLCERISCGYPPSITRGHIVPVKVNEIYYQDEARVTCEGWYETERSKIQCTETGDWQSATCLDYYPNDPKSYNGRTSVTETGRICQRWDQQIPHPHEHIDLQYFPESTLSEAKNYCRDPEEGDYDPWCMTMDPDKEWEYCNVIKCPWA